MCIIVMKWCKVGIKIMRYNIYPMLDMKEYYYPETYILNIFIFVIYEYTHVPTF